MNLAYTISSDIKIHKVYFPNVSTYFLTASFTILACKIFHFIVGNLDFLWDSKCL